MSAGPLEGIRVTASIYAMQGRNDSFQALSDERGLFELGDVEAVTHMLSFTGVDGGRSSLKVHDVRPGDFVEARLPAEGTRLIAQGHGSCPVHPST